jgi:hypothetical protein
MKRNMSLANCYFAHDFSGFPVPSTIVRCAIWSTSSPPWHGCSNLAASIPKMPLLDRMERKSNPSQFWKLLQVFDSRKINGRREWI